MAHPRKKLNGMGLSPAVYGALRAQGWTRLEHLKGQTAETLAKLKGVGKESAARLASEVAAMSTAHR